MPAKRAENPPRTLEGRIYGRYGSMSPAEKRLSDILLQHQMDLPSYTAGELAEKAKVSKATAARLIRTLGYASYPDAKRQVRAEQHWGSPLAEIEAAVPAESVSLATVVQADIDNIRSTAASIPSETLAQVSRTIARARRVWIMGLRSGHGLAHHASHYLGLIKRDVRVIPVGAFTYARDIASIDAGDAFLAIAFRRRPRLLPTLLLEARAAGAATVLITDISAGASAKAADHVLRCRCTSPSPFNSFSAAVTLINYLAWSVATELGEESIAQFRRIDRLVGLLDDVSMPQSDARR
ncbi:MAG: MurR/RpiR family transcriptional regulator [Microvirga sp.]